MARPGRKYALDTNIFIRAFRDENANARLQAFHAANAPFEYMSAIVAQELRAGATPHHARELQRHVLEPFERPGRFFAPSYDTWKQAGEVLASLVAEKIVDWRHVSRSFLNDVLLAASCREAGVVLMTDNVADFERIQNVLKFSFVSL
ncbi:MAG TPA: type II toxin-antitoxin system VapC family toxin [Gemmatimonadaceae bacterium]|nr:type II toxin-antitoxin system VapC family toxin [Gemmatimonadaceae bacterium]